MAQNTEIREESSVVGRTIGVLVLLTGLLLAAHLCAAESPGSNPIPSIFEPHSTPAESIYHLSLFVLGITSLIFLVVFSLLLYVVVKFRGRAADESWSLPFSVLLSTPVAIFGAFAVLWLRRFLVSVFYPALSCADRERRVLADRSRYADRSSRKERHFDRGIREGPIREGETIGRCRPRRSPFAFATDSHDVVRIYSRLRTAVERLWRGRRCAPNHGHHSYWWHARRELHRHLLRARNFLLS